MEIADMSEAVAQEQGMELQSDQEEYMSFATKIERQKALVYDVREDGKFYVIKVKPSLNKAFKEVISTLDPSKLPEYGEILHSGEGEPSAELKAELNEAYGMYKDAA